METKTSRVAIPEVMYLHLKKKMKEEGEHKNVGEYILQKLSDFTITTCENDKLAKENEALKQANEQLLKERRQVAIQIAASEARVNSLQKELKAKETIDKEFRSLKDKYITMSKANEIKDIEVRKLKGEKVSLEQRLRVVEAENELNKTLLDYKQTFFGKIKNLFE